MNGVIFPPSKGAEMKLTIGWTLSALVAIALIATLYPVTTARAAGDQGALDGKAIFLSQKCNLCHSVSSAGIEATIKSEKMRGPDLVTVSKDHDAAWVEKFLKKEVELDGKKHGKEFKGSDEELKALADWIVAQKPAK
jgi:mono/diheme cytochrome c family protein